MTEPGDLGWASGTRATLRNTGSGINRALPGFAAGPAQGSAPASGPAFVGGFSSPHHGGAHVAMGDGSVRFVSERVRPEILQKLANRCDGGLVSADDF
jgi:hypothetical protein